MVTLGSYEYLSNAPGCLKQVVVGTSKQVATANAGS